MPFHSLLAPQPPVYAEDFTRGPTCKKYMFAAIFGLQSRPALNGMLAAVDISILQSGSQHGTPLADIRPTVFPINLGFYYNWHDDDLMTTEEKLEGLVCKATSDDQGPGGLRIRVRNLRRLELGLLLDSQKIAR